MRACVIALLCVGAGVLFSCSKDAGENGNGISAEVHIDVPTNHADTWTALKVILKDAGYTMKWTHGLFVNLDSELPLELVATHKDGTKLDVTLVPDGVRVHNAPRRESGGTKVLITEDMGMRGATANDVAKWLEDRQWPKLLKRLKEKVRKR